MFYTKEIGTLPPTLSLIEQRVAGRSARDIALGIGGLVSEGELAPGDRLPTVRDLAHRLGVSSSTVADAWRILSAHGVIDTARRNGTTVRAARGEMTGRFWQVPSALGTSIVDLSTGTPDTELLPPLGPVLHHLHTDIEITSYIDRPVLWDLEEELRRRWPFPPAAVTVVDGALDALDRLVSAVVSFGDTVIVEDPTFPPLLDMLERLGARVIGVAVDGEGPRLDQWRAGLEASPVAAFIQPRDHNPTGTSLSPGRARDLATTLERAPACWVIEDNHSGGLSPDPPASLGPHLPGRVVHIHSYSKTHGPDLRIAAIGGAEEPIRTVVDRRRLGPSWTSRLIQHILLTMLTDPATEALVTRAGAIYTERRRALSQRLAASGVDVHPGEGLNLWIRVADEQRAVVSLALEGIGVAPGRPFRVDSGAGQPHIRVSLGEARSDLDRLASAIAIASQA